MSGRGFFTQEGFGATQIVGPSTLFGRKSEVRVCCFALSLLFVKCMLSRC